MDGEKAAPTPSKISVPSMKPGSIWEGSLLGNTKGALPYPGSLTVTERSGDNFRAIYSYADVIVEVEGHLDGDEISFPNTKLVRGKELVPAVQTGQVKGDLMKGTWWLSHTANGKFEFARRASN